MSDPKIRVGIEFTANTQAGEKSNQVLKDTAAAADKAAASTAKYNQEATKAANAKPPGFSKAGGLPIDQFNAQQGKPAAPSGVLEQFKAIKTEFNEAGGGIKGSMAVVMGSGASIAAWAAGIASAFALAGKALAAFADKQVQVAKMDAVLANQGRLTDEYREKLQALASTQAKLTGTSGNDWIAALTTGLKHGATDLDQFALGVKNLAGFLDTSIPDAAFLFSKALAGNTEMLRRYGIEVDASKSRTEQLASIMDQTASGGAALESRAKTITGQFEAFNGSIKRLFTGLGLVIAQTGIVQAVLYGLTETLSGLGKMFPKIVPQIDGLRNSFARATRTMEEQEAAAKKLADYTAALGKNAEQAAQKHDQLRDSISRVAQAQIEMVDAEHGRDVILIDDSVKRFEASNGREGISPAEGARQKAALAQRAEEAKFQAEQGARQAEVAADEGRLKSLEDAAKVAHTTTVFAENAKANYERNVVPARQANWQAGQDHLNAVRALQAAEQDLERGSTGPTEWEEKKKRVADAKADVERLRFRKDKTRNAQAAAEQVQRQQFGDANVEKARAEEKAAQDALEKGRGELAPRITAGRETIAAKDAVRTMKRPGEVISTMADIAKAQREEIERLRQVVTDPGRTAAGAAPLTGGEFAGVVDASNRAADTLNKFDVLRTRLPELSHAAKTDPAKANELAALLATLHRMQTEVAQILSGVSAMVTPPNPNYRLGPTPGPTPEQMGIPKPVAPTADQRREADFQRRERELVEKIARDQENLNRTGAGAASLEAWTRVKTQHEEQLRALRSAHDAVVGLSRNLTSTLDGITRELGDLNSQVKALRR